MSAQGNARCLCGFASGPLLNPDGFGTVVLMRRRRCLHAPYPVAVHAPYSVAFSAASLSDPPLRQPAHLR